MQHSQCHATCALRRSVDDALKHGAGTAALTAPVVLTPSVLDMPGQRRARISAECLAGSALRSGARMAALEGIVIQTPTSAV